MAGDQENIMKHEADEEDEMEDEDPVLFPCTRCTATFVTEISLNRHMFVHEDLISEDSEASTSPSKPTMLETILKRERVPTVDVGPSEDTSEGPPSKVPKLQTQLMENEREREHDMDGQKVEEVAGGLSRKAPKLQSQVMESILKRVIESNVGGYPSDHITEGPPMAPKLQVSKPIPNLKPLPPLIPKKEFEMAQMKQFACATCGVCFGKKEDLARHVTRTHGGAKFICPYCNRNISRRDHLKRHIKNVHPEYCTDTEIGPFLADPNASRADKVQHAENFVAQYTEPALHIYPEVTVNTEVKNSSRPQSQYVSIVNSSSILETHLQEQSGQKYNDVDLEEEGDDEFEGEDESETENGTQEITVEPELLPHDDYDDEYEQKYEDPHNLTIEEFQQLAQSQHNQDMASNFNTTGHETNGISGLIERKFKCDDCGAAFMSKINLQRHVSTHSIVRPHKCNICGKGFLRKEHLTKHLSSVHSGMKFTCQFCGKDISRKDHLLRHIRNCHPAEFMGMPPEILVQQVTHKNITQDESLSYQSSNMLSPRLQPTQKPKTTVLACDICYDQFLHIDELHEHQSSMHSAIWRFKCSHCPKSFKRKEHLVKHEVLHTGEKKFGCEICRKVFTRKDAVYDHIRRSHPETISNAFLPCNLCEQIFKNQIHLNQHKKSFHGVSHNFHNPDENNMYENATLDTKKRHSNPAKVTSAVQAKLHSLGLEISGSGDVDGNLGSLMGLINRGSLSLSRIASSGQE